MAITMKCPYYIDHNKGRVECESLTDPTGSTTHLIEVRIGTYLRKHCASMDGWEKCPYAIALNESYAEKEIFTMEVFKEKEDIEYELGRYKKKVLEQMKTEKQLREHIEYQNLMIENALLYIVHLGIKAADQMPCCFEVDYKELREEVNNYQVKYEPVENKGMKVFIHEKEAETNTETEK